MALREQILSDMKSAMKAKETSKLTTLRVLQAAIKNKEIDVRPNEVSEKDIQDVVKKLVKQRKESIEQYKAANRDDLAAQEASEIDILSVYLPEQMSEEKVAAIVEEAIQSLGATSMKDMGGVMKEVMAKTNGAADNKIISQLIKSKLQ